MRYEFLIGLRYTRAKRRNHFISFISLISMAGIALGVAALIVVLSVMNGFQQELRARILGVVSHVQIFGADNRLEHWQQTAAAAARNPHVVAAARFVSGQGLLPFGHAVPRSVVRWIMTREQARVRPHRETARG